MQDDLIINGPQYVDGVIRVSGAKNSILPILCASLLSEESIELTNVPNLNDVHILIGLIRKLGREAIFEDEKVIIGPKTQDYDIKISDEANKIRYSILLLGAILASENEVVLPFPGGCSFSARPIDIHLEGLKMLGAEIKEGNDCIIAKTTNLCGADIALKFPSVGATENLIIAASKAKGKTILRNIAIEPEINDLISFMNKIGAKIRFIEANVIEIYGSDKLGLISIKHDIIPDRIEAATYFILGALSSRLYLEIDGFIVKENLSFLSIMQKMGIEFDIINGEKVRVFRSKNIKGIDVETGVFPNLATDIQPLLAVLMTQASGTSQIIDHIYPERFQYAKELISMGANIELIESGLIITGKTDLYPTREVYSFDLRGGAALILAGIVAEGNIKITNTYQIYRGYSNINEKLRNIGICLSVGQKFERDKVNENSIV